MLGKHLRHRLELMAELMRKHDGQRLIAGNHAGEHRRQQDAAKGRDAPAENLQPPLQRMQEARALEDSRIAGRQTHDSKHAGHGHDSAAAQKRGQLRRFRMIAPEGNSRQLRRRHLFQPYSQHKAHDNAHAHRALYIDTQQRECNDAYRRQCQQRMKKKAGSEDFLHRSSPRTRIQQEAGSKIQPAGCEKRYNRGADHIVDVAEQIGGRQRADQQSARRHRRAAVAKINAGQYGPARIRRRNSHTVCHGHADDTHRRGSPEGRACQHGDDAAEPEGQKQHQRR